MATKTKILIGILAIAVMVGGVLVWQYWWVTRGSGKEPEIPENLQTIKGTLVGPLGHPHSTTTNVILAEGGGYYVVSSNRTDLDTTKELIGKKVVARGYVSEIERIIPTVGEFARIKERHIEVISYSIQ